MSEFYIQVASKDNPYCEGQCAFCDGLSRVANPYTSDSDDCARWIEGYDDEELSIGNLLVQFEMNYKERNHYE